MNEKKTSIWNRPFLPRVSLFGFVRWLFSWRIIRRCLFCLAVVVTLIAVFYAEEDWRGKRAWNRYRQEMEAKGVQMDFRALWPKPVPDDQNFAATPMIKKWFEKPYSDDTQKRWQYNFWIAFHTIPMRLDKTGKWQFTDLVAWEEAFTAIRSGEINKHHARYMNFASNQPDSESRAKAAVGVLEYLKTDEANFAELRAASQRPFARYPFNYDLENKFELFVPGVLGTAVERLDLKSCAELAMGQSEAALEDVKLMLYLVDSLEGEPSENFLWNRRYFFETTVRPIWEGLAEHAWSEPQLRELTTLLQRYNFLADCQLDIDAERTEALWLIDKASKSDKPTRLIENLADLTFYSGTRVPVNDTLAQLIPWPDMVCRIVPSGWYAREKISYCQFYQMHLRTGFEPDRKRVSPREIQANAAEAHRLYRQNMTGIYRAVLDHRFAAERFRVSLSEVLYFCFAQSTADQTALACALERYHLAHGEFPEKLNSLTPQFISKIPMDVISGEPYKYRRTDDRRFVLYSVGWNETDDGGTVAMTKDGDISRRNGDWVWPQYPAK